jgi:hypothetical protein
MSVIGSNILAGASGQGGVYNLTKSLRFRKSASAYLNRTPASAGNQKTFTFSTWLKRGALVLMAVLLGTQTVMPLQIHIAAIYYVSLQLVILFILASS